MLQLLPDAEQQVKPEPEDTGMTTEAAPSSAPIAGQPVKTEPPTQAPADPNTNVCGVSVQPGDAAGVASVAALASRVSAATHAGSFTPESSAQVLYVYKEAVRCSVIQ